MNHLGAHRGPDGAGCYIAGSVALGHRRLAIIDRQAHSSQPFQRGNLIVVFNGEIFNYRALRSELAQLGHAFHTSSDTEVLLAAWQQWGADCQQRFNGMWAFILYDLEQQVLFASRDRYGIKPLYYTQAGDQWCYASEIKQFKGVEAWGPRINRMRAFEFLYNGYFDHTAETLFDGVFQLRPGHFITHDVRNGHRKTTAYYQLSEAALPLPTASDAQYIAQWQSLWQDAVSIRLRADVPVGVALSGGLDSASLALTAARVIHTPLPCISVLFAEKGFNENAEIDATVQFGLFPHIGIVPDFQEMTAHIEDTLWHMDEPFGSMTMIAGYLLFKEAARQGWRVLMTGQGADEILAGYEKFYRPLLLALCRQHKWAGAVSNVYGFWRHHPQIRRTVLQKAAIPQREKAHTRSWLSADFIPETEGLFQRRAEGTVTACSINLFQEVGLPMLLHYEDRNSMAHGVEARLPFLDHRLVEFCIGLPDDLKIRSGIRKHILRTALSDILPPHLRVQYDKKSFVCPEFLVDAPAPALFRRQLETAVHCYPFIFSRKLVVGFDDYVAGKHQNDGALWRAYVFAKWLQKWDFYK